MTGVPVALAEELDADWSRVTLEMAPAEHDVVELSQSAPGSVEHGVRLIDRDDLFDVRRQQFRCVSRSAAEVRDDAFRIEQGQQGGGGEAATEKVGTEFVPFAADAAEERQAVGAPFSEDGLEATVVFAKLGVVGHLGADGPPQRPGIFGQFAGAEAVIGGGALGALSEPADIGQALEPPTDGGLGQLNDLGDLTDAQLMLLQQSAEPQTQRVSQSREPIRQPRSRAVAVLYGLCKCFRHLHPFIRMKCRKNSGRVKPGPLQQVEHLGDDGGVQVAGDLTFASLSVCFGEAGSPRLVRDDGEARAGDLAVAANPLANLLIVRLKVEGHAQASQRPLIVADRLVEVRQGQLRLDGLAIVEPGGGEQGGVGGINVADLPRILCQQQIVARPKPILSPAFEERE